MTVQVWVIEQLVPDGDPAMAVTEATLQLSVTLPTEVTTAAAAGKLDGLHPKSIFAVGHAVKTGSSVSIYHS